MENSAFVQDVDTRLWLPGTSAADPRVRKVSKAVERYDEAFRLARHELTGDWVVVIGEQGHPVFGFGRELPAPEDVETILGKHDIKRNGKRIWAQIQQITAQERAKEEAKGRASSERTAEILAHQYEKVGAHRHPRIFVPRGIPK